MRSSPRRRLLYSCYNKFSTIRLSVRTCSVLSQAHQLIEFYDDIQAPDCNVVHAILINVVTRLREKQFNINLQAVGPVPGEEQWKLWNIAKSLPPSCCLVCLWFPLSFAVVVKFNMCPGKKNQTSSMTPSVLSEMVEILEETTTLELLDSPSPSWFKICAWNSTQAGWWVLTIDFPAFSCACALAIT